MALKSSDLNRKRAPFIDDEGTLPTDEDVARHLKINPDVFRAPRIEGNKTPAASLPKPEGPRQPGEGKV